MSTKRRESSFLGKNDPQLTDFLRNRLPFEWVTGIKSVLSDLTGRNEEQGRNKRTVNHIFLLEDYVGSRLKRKRNSFLCTAPSGSNGKFPSDRFKASIDTSEMPPPTCSLCILHAQKIAKGNSKKFKD